MERHDAKLMCEGEKIMRTTTTYFLPRKLSYMHINYSNR